MGTNDAFFATTVPAVGATVATQQSTASGSYTDLGTVGPAVTLATLTSVIVIPSAQMNNDTLNDYVLMGVAVSGATTRAATDTNAIEFQNATVGQWMGASNASFMSGLTSGSNTFTGKYRIAVGGTGTFLNRSLAVIPLTT